jgi:hypothetical protein
MGKALYEKKDKERREGWGKSTTAKCVVFFTILVS